MIWRPFRPKASRTIMTDGALPAIISHNDMSLIKNIRTAFYKRALQRQLKAKADPDRPAVSFQSAVRIGLLFDATDLDERETTLAYAKSLKQRGKKVKMLGFFDNKLDNPNFTFPHFNQKDIDWAERPGGKAVEEFLQQKMDIFIHLATKTTSYTEYIAALANAPMRVGPCTDQTFCYEVMIDLAGPQTLEAFIKEAEKILKITNTRHEAAKI